MPLRSASGVGVLLLVRGEGLKGFEVSEERLLRGCGRRRPRAEYPRSLSASASPLAEEPPLL